MDLFISRRGGPAAEKPALPVLDESYPKDASIEYIRGNSASVTFSVSIAQAGVPAEYTYQWYVNDAAVGGATNDTYTVSGALEAGTKSVYCRVINAAGTVQSRTATLSVNVLYTPGLSTSQPADVTGIQYYTGSATFSVSIASAGNPAQYTYQWYMDNAAVNGATGQSYTFSNFTSAATHSVYCRVTNRAGTVQSRTATLQILTYKPTYSYTGTSQFIEEGNGNWKLKLTSSGTLSFSKLDSNIDVFCVGGGGGGSSTCNYARGSGGGGGYTKTQKNIAVDKNTGYAVTIGAGGNNGEWNAGGSVSGAGGTTSAFNVTAEGGGGTYITTQKVNGGNGGSGGGGNSTHLEDVYAGGTDGGNGASGYAGDGGTGQGTTTREFGEAGGTLYASGGRGNVTGAVSSVQANTGNGGDGVRMMEYTPGKGSSGIVVIRNAR